MGDETKQSAQKKDNGKSIFFLVFNIIRHQRDTHLNHFEISSHLSQSDILSLNQMTKYFGKYIGYGEYFHHVTGNAAWCHHQGTALEASSLLASVHSPSRSWQAAGGEKSSVI